MEDAAVHAVDGVFAANPMWGLVVGIIIIVSIVAIKLVPFYKEMKIEHEKNETEIERKRIDNEHQLEMERLDIERAREARKSEELAFRKEREIANASISQQFVDATNRSTAVIQALVQSMEVTNAQIEMSRDGSKRMGSQIQDIHVKVYDIDSTVEDIKSQLL